jgi:hypothetical protein
MSEFTPVLITLPGASLSAEILPYGLFVRSINVVADGKTHVSAEDRIDIHNSQLISIQDIVINPFDPKENGNARAFLNPVVGRYSNRVPAKTMTVQRLGTTAEVTPIATGKRSGPHTSVHLTNTFHLKNLQLYPCMADLRALMSPFGSISPPNRQHCIPPPRQLLFPRVQPPSSDTSVPTAMKDIPGNSLPRSYSRSFLPTGDKHLSLVRC